ncbi:hypothetical protein PROFUN_05980 [Planoprotostelium fungivorum]|uniref:Uncharacterized protein n=1 Tax=Planoprotostelium fungivorum TaxID=1890364 RepID=A0A2P6NPG6_9EUKA|nr:hypothetical protein PROFUN_05980 [Planoprotostelium fungivorum]
MATTQNNRPRWRDSIRKTLSLNASKSDSPSITAVNEKHYRRQLDKYKIKLDAIWSIFKQVKHSVIRTMDKLLRASFYESSDGTVSQLIRSIEGVNELLKGWMSMLDEDSKSPATLLSQMREDGSRLLADCAQYLNFSTGDAEQLKSKIETLNASHKELEESYGRYQRRYSDFCDNLSLNQQVLNAGVERLHDHISLEDALFLKLGEIQQIMERYNRSVADIFDALQETSRHIEEAQRELPVEGNVTLQTRERIEDTLKYLEAQLDLEAANREAANYLMTIGARDEQASSMLERVVDSQATFDDTVEKMTNILSNLSDGHVSTEHGHIRADLDTLIQQILQDQHFLCETEAYARSLVLGSKFATASATASATANVKEVEKKLRRNSSQPAIAPTSPLLSQSEPVMTITITMIRQALSNAACAGTELLAKLRWRKSLSNMQWSGRVSEVSDDDESTPIAPSE